MGVAGRLELAGAVCLDPEASRVALREGRVTRRVEEREGEDAGRFRGTFFAPTRRLRLLFAADGAILQTSSADYSRKLRVIER